MSDAPKFTREELVQYSNPNTTFYGPTIRDLAAFALALLDRAEKAEEESARLTRLCDQYTKSHICEVDKRYEAERIAAGNLARAEKAEAELAEAEEAIRLIERITVTYEDARGDGESEGVAKVGQAFLDHPAVRRALERGKG